MKYQTTELDGYDRTTISHQSLAMAFLAVKGSPNMGIIRNGQLIWVQAGDAFKYLNRGRSLVIVSSPGHRRTWNQITRYIYG